MENHLHQEATVAYKWRTTCFHGQNKNESRVWPAMYCFEEHVTAQYEGWIGRRPDLVHSAGTRRSPVQKLCVSRFHLGRFQFEPWSFFSLSSSLRSLFPCSNERNMHAGESKKKLGRRRENGPHLLFIKRRPYGTRPRNPPCPQEGSCLATSTARGFFCQRESSSQLGIEPATSRVGVPSG